ncbi:hypothetical protein AGMMS49573_10850 [Endomicrobiia bacterium]|nr:hypothetical protein AGMMS49573_10850 [Endomicrobiia bacterium]
MSRVLQWVSDEMMKRYDMMAEQGAKNIGEYNKAAQEKFPSIVIIIDELADLMLSKFKNRIEKLVNRIAAMGRAAGIHLVIATQRADSNILTGLIKANIPTRIAFKTSASINSRIILDEKGAECLLGKGDMLFHKSDGNNPMRLQGTYVSTEELERIVDFVKVDHVDYDAGLVGEFDPMTDASLLADIELFKRSGTRLNTGCFVTFQRTGKASRLSMCKPLLT